MCALGNDFWILYAYMSILQQQQQQQQTLKEGEKSSKASSLLQRNSSQLLQHATRLGGLRRSRTTKVSTSPQILSQRPRPSISFSSSANSKNKMKYQQQQPLQLKEYIPPPPLTDAMFDSIVNGKQELSTGKKKGAQKA